MKKNPAPRKPEPFVLEIGLSLWIFLIALLLLLWMVQPLVGAVHYDLFIAYGW